MNIKALIIENEPKIAQDFLAQIKSKLPALDVVGTASGVDSGIKAIKQMQPALVFLDVELDNGETGFDILKKISPVNFGIIFTTAYNKYAIEAIRCSAIDYLLKPVIDEELVNAVAKFVGKNDTAQSKKIESLLAALSNPGSQQNTIPFPTMEGFEMVIIADILYCEGESSQTIVILNNKRKMVVSKTLKECEELLSPYRFFRIHKSYLINLNHLKKYLKGQDGTAIMADGKALSVSRNVKDKFIERVSML